jgi:ATP-binding cassette subfamily C protein CydCD
VVWQARLLSVIVSQVFLAQRSLNDEFRLLVGLLAIYVLRASVLGVGEMAGGYMASKIKVELRKQLYQHIQSLGPVYVRQEQTGELVNLISEGIESLEAYFRQYLPQIVLAAVVPLTFLIFILPFDRISGIILLLTAPLIPLFMVLIGDRANALTKLQWKTLGRISAHFLDVLQGITTLKTFGRSREQARVIEQVSDKYRRTTLGVLRVSFLSALVLELVSMLSIAIIAVEIGLRLLSNQLSFEGAFFILILAPEFYLPLRALGTRFHSGMTGFEAAKRIFQILEEPIDPRSNPTASKSGYTFHDPDGCVKIDNLHFSYPDGRQALKGISFEIPFGQMTALVGPSGAGKTTLAYLLLGFIKPQRGKILIGNDSIDQIPNEDWVSYISWVPQNPYLFNDSILENIRIARPTANLDQVIQAARLAHAYEFIQNLPQGLETPVGERGILLSAGQAQRIALARAFLKDAPILIMDEPAANLDPEGALLIQQATAQLSSDRTTLVIAHRLNSVLQADQIIVISGGRLIERGTHTELIEKAGFYQHLVGAFYPSIEEESSLPATSDIFDKPFPFRSSPPSFRRSQGGLNPGFNTSILPNFSQIHYPTEANQDRLLLASEADHLSNQLIPNSLSIGWETFFRLLSFLSPFKGRIAVSTLLGFATIASGVGLMATSAYIISAAALRPSIATLQVAIVGVRFFGLSRGIFRYLERYNTHDITFRLLAKLRLWFYKAIEPLAPANLPQYRSGDLLNRIIADISILENFYVRGAAPFSAAILVIIAISIFMAFFNTTLAIILLIFLLAGVIGLPGLVLFLNRDYGMKSVIINADLTAALVEGIQGMPEVRIFKGEKAQTEKIDRLSSNLDSIKFNLNQVEAFKDAFELVFVNVATWIILVISINLVHEKLLAGIYLAVIVLATITCFEALYPLPSAAHHMSSSLTAGKRLFDILDAKPQVLDPDRHVPLTDKSLYTPIPDHQQTVKSGSLDKSRNLACTLASSTRKMDPKKEFCLTIKNLSFQYPQSDQSSGLFRYPHNWDNSTQTNQFAIRDLSFSLPIGGKIALVGPSGAGKTTLVNLLLRFWDYSEGEIQLGLKDIRDYPQEEVRHLFSLVSQDTHLFNASVRDNLLIANPQATESDLIDATQQAQIHDFILSLPEGYDTWIGEWGLRLSGGERQRLAIARALLKKSPILILDEATSGLDALVERQILLTVRGLMEKRATLMITHRLVGLELMDEIIVLKQGEVLERGCQHELLRNKGYYWRMWQTQNQILCTQ